MSTKPPRYIDPSRITLLPEEAKLTDPEVSFLEKLPIRSKLALRFLFDTWVRMIFGFLFLLAVSALFYFVLPAVFLWIAQ